MTSFDPSGGVALITDGSSNWQDKSGGWAWVAIDAHDGIRTGSGFRHDVTNNQMELLAAISGLEAVCEAYGACEVLVYADSEYVVLGATDKTRKRNKNKAYWHRLEDAITRHTHVEFIHVKGHRGHHWNEMADQMAGEARKTRKAMNT